MSKYEKSISKIGWLLLNGEIKRAESLFLRLWKHMDDMSDIEIEVMNSHRESLYGRPFSGGFSEEANYWEGRILARQESDWD